MGIFTNKAPSPHHNTARIKAVSNYGAIPNWKQTTGTIPGTAPQVNIPNQQGSFGNPKAALDALPTIFTLAV